MTISKIRSAAGEMSLNKICRPCKALKQAAQRPRMNNIYCKTIAFLLTLLVAGTSPAAEPISARVCLHEGRPTLFLNDQPTLPLLYGLTHSPGARWSWEEVPQYSIAQFAKAGVRLFQADLWLEQMWTAQDKFDINLARRQIQGILDACPDAAVMLRLHVNSPPWWNQAHPEECVQYANGPLEDVISEEFYIPLALDLRRVPRHSMASRRWLEECGAKTRELCEQLAKTPQGDALFAIQVAAGVYGEWHYYGFTLNEPDVGPAMTSHFRQWLRTKYGADDALRAAWNDPNASIAAATVPGLNERLHTCDGYFRDPQKEQRVIDYFHCQHESVTEAFIHFCRIVKESWPRPIVTGGFHGYWFTMFGRMAAGGHLEVARALNSPFVDFLCAPQSYSHLGIGSAGMSRGMLESCRLHGKLWLDEMDTAPVLWDPRRPDRKDALSDSITILRRNVMQPFSRGMGMWYYDLLCERDFRPAGRACGWWDNPQLQEEIARLRAVTTDMFQRPLSPAADVLLVFDTESFYFVGHDAKQDPVSPELIDKMTDDLYHSGAAFDVIYLSDLVHADLRQYKVVIFANAFRLDARQRELIKEKVAQDGRHIIWLCAPGYADGSKLNAEQVAVTVGMNLQRVHLPSARVAVDGEGLPMCNFGFTRPIEPLFAVDDPCAAPLGHLNGSTYVGLARKQLDQSTSWFCSVPMTNDKLLCSVLRQAGAHIYDDAGDVIYAGGGVLTVHTANGGKRTLVLRNGKRIETELPHRSTTLFDAATGENLLPQR